MVGDAAQQDTAEPVEDAPAPHHRKNSTTTKSLRSKQLSPLKLSSPVSESKKRKRKASEVAGNAAVVSRLSQPQELKPTASTTEKAPQQSQPLSSVYHISSTSIGKSASMASVNPCDGELQPGDEVSNDQQSSAGAEDEATATNDGNVVWRSKEKLAACLCCDLCSSVLMDPVTAPECMHSFCRDCIDHHVLFGGTKNTCPVCKTDGLETVLGPQPFQHGKLQFDPMLADMIRKLFPRPDVEKSIQERRDSEAKYRASLPVKKPKTGSARTPAQTGTFVAGHVPAAAAGTSVPVQALQSSHVNPSSCVPLPAANARVGLFLQTDAQTNLHLPYLWVQQTMSLKSLGSYVCSQLQLDHDSHQLRLECEGASLHSNVTLYSVAQQWFRSHQLNELIVIQVIVEQTTIPSGNYLK